MPTCWPNIHPWKCVLYEQNYRQSKHNLGIGKIRVVKNKRFCHTRSVKEFRCMMNHEISVTVTLPIICRFQKYWNIQKGIFF